MRHLSSIDLAIIVGYFVLTVAVGLAMSRRASSSINDYFLGGRSLPWYLLGIAGMTNWFDLTGTMIITSFLYMLGPRGLYIEFRGGAVLMLAFLIAYTGKWHRRSGCMTGAEWMTYRFGTSKSAESLRVVQAAVAIAASIMMLAYLVRGASLFLGMLFPFPPMYSTLVLLMITSLYTVSAGFYGVVLTDLVQGIIVICACVIVAVIAFHLVPSGADLSATAMAVTHNPDWSNSAPAFHVYMPDDYAQYRWLVRAMLFYLICQVLYGMGSGSETRYFAARSDRDCGLQSALQGITVAFRWPLMISFAIMGIYLVHSAFPDETATQKAAALIHHAYPKLEAAYWHDRTNRIINVPGEYPDVVPGLKKILGENWAVKLPLVSYHGTVNPEQILPAVLLGAIPTGLRGILLVAMFSAMMSSKNSTVNSASAFFVRDIYQNALRPKARNFELILTSYISTLAIVAAGFYFGVAAGSINDLWGWIIMSFNAGALAPGVLRLYWWRCNAWGMFGGLALGGIGAVVQRIWAPAMPEWESFIIMTSLSFLGTIGLSLLTAPTPTPILRHFFRTTRPFGMWGRMMRELPAAEQHTLRKEHRNDILTVPFALVTQITLFLMPMQILVKTYGTFWRTLPLFIVGMVGLYFFWWRALPRRESTAPKEPDTESFSTAETVGGIEMPRAV
jgi:SSS family solute:Na+ symporter